MRVRGFSKISIGLIILIILILFSIYFYLQQANPYDLAYWLHCVLDRQRKKQNRQDSQNHQRYLDRCRDVKLRLEQIPSGYCSAWATRHRAARKLNDDLMIHYRTIRQEVLRVCERYEGLPMIELDEIQHGSFFKTAPNWKVLWVKFFDQWGPYSEYMPTLKQVVQRHPEIVLFHISLMEPNTVLPIHQGISPAVVRYHLPIQIPPGEVYLNLDGHRVEWTEGEGFVFDDCLPHGVIMKPSVERVRIILFADAPRYFNGPFGSIYSTICDMFHSQISWNIHINRIKRKIANHRQLRAT